MLCVDCKENVAVIFVKNASGQIGLCADCAKKRGIDPMKAMMDQFSNNPAFDIQNLTAQIDKLMSEMDPEELEKLSNAPFMAFNFDDIAKMQKENEEKSNSDSDSDKNQKDTVKKKNKKTKTLDTFGINLTEKARLNELDIVIGRESELERMIQILNRRSKNNPALIGEPGVGKTALVNALAIKIAKGDVPQKLLDKEVYLLDMTSLMAGTQFRGQFEARVKGIIDECKANGNIILAIDEVHNIVGGQEHDNSMNAANMLKPALASGSVQLIGATTLKEYRKYIEKDTALERRFQTVIIDEPTQENTIEILKGLRPYYESYHKVKIPDEALEKAVELSVKYIHDRFLPDKAIDLMDEAASRVNLDDKVLAEITKTSFEISTLEEALNKIETESQTSDEANEESSSVETFEKAAILKENICKLKTKLDELNKKARKNIVTDDHLAKVVELWTKIPVSKIKTSDKEKLLNLEKHLNSKIIGQPEATHDISAAIIRRRAGLQNTIKPPSFIFVGPTGVGKTALVKALAEALFDSSDAVIKLDMSEYSESHSTSKLIGAPPGYVGYDEAGQLTEKVRRNPYSIILFDEIEKAHSSIYNVLLQILDEGILTDAQGKSVSFKHTVIIMTSNLGTNFKNDSYGFGDKKIVSDSMKKHVEGAIKDFFTPEFLNRVDETIIFNKLDKDNIDKISKLMLDEFIKDTSKKGFEFEFTKNVIDYISDIGFDSKFGARPLRRAIQKNIEDVLAVWLFEGRIKPHKKYTIDYVDNALKVVE